MTRLYRQPIEVKTTPKGIPVEFHWRGQWYQVTDCMIKEELPSVLEWWRRNAALLRYRCFTKQGLVCDLIRDGEGWVLERVWD